MQPRILTIGSANMDLVMRMSRIPSEGETVLDSGTVSYIPGGKGANCAVALAKLGAESIFCTRLGKDLNGQKLYELYESFGINTSCIKVEDKIPTGQAAIMVEESGANRIVVYPGANRCITLGDVEEALDTKPEAVCLQFEIPFATTVAAAKMAKARGIPVILDAAPASPDYPLGDLPEVDIFSPNETETMAFTGIQPTGHASCMKAAIALSRMVKAKAYVLKLGNKGAFVLNGSLTNMLSAYRVEVVDTTAAGDAFMAGLAMAYVRNGGNAVEACKIANAVGALTVTRAGASSSIPTAEEVEKFFSASPL